MRTQKTVSLTVETSKIAKRIEARYHSGFSGWLRSVLRQWNEEFDPVKLELNYAALKQAVAQQEHANDIFNLMQEIKSQASLEDFQ
ncbi:unnamed protein product [marine sediment metagenome]|uniref:Uncharacterized protein n=1 Tax=marine sediment metagenome TaxID=412755 RepID=X1GP13_9ZZZZ